MDVSSKLVQEHQLILRFVERIRVLSPGWETAPFADTVWVDQINGIIRFIRGYADRYHHAKEEDILFRHLAAPGVLSHCNPLPVMLSDHEVGREYVRAMEAAINTGDKIEAAGNARLWADHLEAHIFKEDNVLYPMAEEGLDDRAKSEILLDYAQAEAAHNGTALEAEFQSLLTRLGG